MANLTFIIETDLDEAAKQMNNLARASEELQKKIEKLGEDMRKTEVGNFIQQQKLLTMVMKSTGKEFEGLIKQNDAYEKKIQSLKNKGVDPASESIKMLQEEIDNTNTNLAELSTNTDNAARSVEEIGNAAVYAAKLTVALGTAIFSMTQETAEMGSETAKTARSIGMTAESFQELDYAAKQSGVNNLGGSLQKLNKNMSDLRRGSGSLAAAITGTNNALLNQLESAKSNEEAFDLLMKAIKEAPDDFTRAEIATAAFGESGHEMINMAMRGADGITALREEAKKYGIMSNETAENSEKFMHAQTKLKTALEGVQIQLTEKLLPVITDIIIKIADFIAGIDNWDMYLKILAVSLGIVTVVLGAFMLVVKGAAIVKIFSEAILFLSGAFKALTLAMTTNPIGAIIAAIAVAITMLIAGITALVKNWDYVQLSIQNGLAHLEYGFKWLASVIKEVLLITFAYVKAAGASLFDFIHGSIIRFVGFMLDVMGKIPGIGDSFKIAADAVNKFGNAIGDMAKEARNSIDDTIAAAKAEQDATEAVLNDKLEASKNAMAARRAELDARKAVIEEEQQAEFEAGQERIAMAQNTANQIAKIDAITLREKVDLFRAALSKEDITEKQAQADKIASVEQFLLLRTEIEHEKLDERIKYMEEQARILLENEELAADGRLAIEEALKNSIDKMRKDSVKREQELLEERLKPKAELLKESSELFKTLSKENWELAVLGKTTAAAEAGINSYLAFTKALASSPPPGNYAIASSVLAAGLSKQMKIWQTDIPPFETGGRFIVPDLSSRVDNIGLRVNAGEEINITPRGEEGGQAIHQIFKIENQTIFEIVNRGLRSGDIYEYSPAWNMQ
ncbi:MAG: hypothetical protein FWD40_10040 [Treponema sp.]|nr:hypothetical protein [Treponema sp.]